MKIMFYFQMPHHGKCRNPECGKPIIGHRCSGYCSTKCMEKHFKTNQENPEEEKPYEINSAAYEKMVSDVNEFLKEHDIGLIKKEEYEDPKLKKLLSMFKQGNDYGTAFLSLKILRRDNIKKLDLAYFGKELI